LKRDKLKSIETRTDYFGIFFVLPAIAVSLLKIGTFHLQFFIFLVFIAGLIYLLYGKTFLKNISFPLFFLVSMIPFPEESYITIANISRHIAFDGALKIISIFGFPYYREGWILHLPNAVLEIAMSCSGIRYLISYVVFGIAYAYLMKNTTKARLATVVLTIPISVVASNLRLTFIFLATYYISPYWSQRRPHILISWAVFFGILILSIWLDQYFANRKKIVRQD
jgi:exosortase